MKKLKWRKHRDLDNRVVEKTWIHDEEDIYRYGLTISRRFTFEKKPEYYCYFMAEDEGFHFILNLDHFESTKEAKKYLAANEDLVKELKKSWKSMLKVQNKFFNKNKDDHE